MIALDGLLLGQVPIMKRGSLHGMPGDLCDCRFNGSMTQLFRGRVDIPFICIVIATNTTEAQICLQIKHGCVWPESHCLCQTWRNKPCIMLLVTRILSNVELVHD